MPAADVERRLASLQAWVIAGLAFMLVASVSLLVAVVILVGRAQDNQNEALACYVLPQLDRAEDTLPSLSYYKEHPDELDKQLGVIAEQRELAIGSWGTCDSLTEGAGE